jgi:TolB-like protein
VRTIPRRGYLFAIPTDTPASTMPGGTMPRVAVLPFRNLTGNTDDGLLIDGLVEEITNGLARFRTVAVVTRHSAFAFRPPPSTGGRGSRGEAPDR